MAVASYLPSPLQRLFINGDERRVRAPFRILSQIVLSFLLAVLPRSALLPTFGFVAQQVGISLAPYESGLTGTLTITTLGLLYFGVTYLLSYGLSSAVVARYVDHRPIRALFTRPGSDESEGRGLALGILAGALAGGALIGGLVAAGLVTLQFQGGDAIGTLARGVGILVASLLYGGSLVYMQVGFYVPNIAEGVRGYLGPRVAVGVAVLTCGLPFGLLVTAGSGFLNPVGFGNYLLFSAQLAAVYLRTERISIPIGIIAGWFSVVLSTGVAGYQFELTDGIFAASQVEAPLLLGANFGLAGGIAGFIANILLLVAVLPFLNVYSNDSAIFERDLFYPHPQREGNSGDD